MNTKKPNRICVKRIQKLTAKDLFFILEIEPWKQLGTTRTDVFKIARTSKKKLVLGLYDGSSLLGVAILQFGFLRGAYLSLLAFKAQSQGLGLGTILLKACELHVFKNYSNFFLCVSGFNRKGQKFYRRHGFKKIGTLKNLIIKDVDEILLRKTREQ
jgi:ribosomal protein S18 acetylase RimI-like enzyme